MGLRCVRVCVCVCICVCGGKDYGARAFMHGGVCVCVAIDPGGVCTGEGTGARVGGGRVGGPGKRQALTTG